MVKKTIERYLKALEAGDYQGITDLFGEDAVVESPLYGNLPARDFFRKLLEDTDHSILTPLRFFTTGDSEKSGAVYFLYEWVMDDGRHASFNVVDVFDFDDNGKIKKLKIIYDTAETRPLFQSRKKGQ